MSLYDGLDISVDHDKFPVPAGNKTLSASSLVNAPNPPSTNANWNASLKLLQTQKFNLQARKAALMQQKRKPGSNLAPVIDLKRSRGGDGEVRFNHQTGRMERGPVTAPSGPSFLGSEPSMALVGITDEYDPMKPNDYEEFSKRRKDERRKEREMEDIRKRMEHEESRRRGDDDGDDRRDSRRSRRRHNDSDDEDDDRPQPGSRSGAAIAPPTALVVDKAAEDNKPVLDIEALAKAPAKDRGPYGGSSGGGSVASKIMARMGYKQGQGLGKKEQGMSMALMVEKTSKRGGKIIHEKDLAKMTEEEEVALMPPPPMPAPVSTTTLMANPSKNMVGPGEVDQDLEPEIAEECSKYGKVVKCMIFEMPEVPEDRAVRIFVEFDQLSASTKVYEERK